MTSNRSAPRRLLLAWLAGALLLVGLPGAAASIGGSTSPPAAQAPAPEDRLILPAASAGEMFRTDVSRYDLARSNRAFHAGPLAAVLPELPTHPRGALALVHGERTDVPGATAPTDSRGRAPPVPAPFRLAGVHST